MYPDKRFKPIAKSGFWALSEWNVETRTVAEIAHEILARSRKPMTEAKLYSLIVAKRPVGKKTIMTLLREDGRFARVPPTT
jgi:hypothetical protein